MSNIWLPLEADDVTLFLSYITEILTASMCEYLFGQASLGIKNQDANPFSLSKWSL